MNPKITVLMPAYNAGKYIGESIQSVIDQTYADWELLIVNDGSTDNTVEVVEGYDDPRIRLLSNPNNLRLIKTLNRGLEEAKGELIARLDADDRASPNRLKLQVEAFEQNERLVLLGGRSHVIDEDGNLKKDGAAEYQPESPVAVRWACVFFNPFRHSAMMFKRSIVWDEFGGYPEDARDLEDYALWVTIVSSYDAANLSEVLCDYRVHSESILANARAKNTVMQDPRRSCAEPYFRRSAVAEGVPELLANEWGRLWPCVRFKQVGDSQEVDRIFKALTAVMAYQPSDPDDIYGVRAVSAAAIYDFHRIVRRQGSSLLRFCVWWRGLRLCGWSFIRLYAASIYRRVQLKVKAM